MQERSKSRAIWQKVTFLFCILDSFKPYLFQFFVPCRKRNLKHSFYPSTSHNREEKVSGFKRVLKLGSFLFLETNPNQAKADRHVCIEMLCSHTSYQHKMSVSKKKGIISWLPCCVLQEEVMVLERILLQTIKFDLQVEHPYQFLLKYAKQLKGKMLQAERVLPVLNF